MRIIRFNNPTMILLIGSKYNPMSVRMSPVPKKEEAETFQLPTPVGAEGPSSWDY